jgi:membrane protein implicated in regulation of membrane protease activity
MVRKALWNPVGVWPSVIGGLAFGVVMSVIVSVIYGTWWYLLFAIPMAVASAVLWRRWYPQAYERARRRLDALKP